MTHPADTLDLFAQPRTDDSEALLQAATRCAVIRSEFDGYWYGWQIQLDLMRAGVIEGTEALDCFGALGRRCGMIAGGHERTPLTLPEEYRTHGNGTPCSPELIERMERLLAKRHGNLATKWRNPTAAERASALARAQRKRRTAA